MLDEEIQFTLVRKFPKTKLQKMLEDITTFAAVTGGAIEGFATAKYGAGFGNIISAFFGGPLGIAAVLGPRFWLEEHLNEIKQEKYEKAEQELDEKAKANNAPSAKFTYRGNDLECVIRPEYEQGHFFPMSIAKDFTVREPFFSYQPKKNPALSFRFAVPHFEEVKVKDTIEILTNHLETTLKKQRKEKDHETHSNKINEQEYISALIGLCQKEAEKRKIKCDIRHESSETNLYTILTYPGENYTTELQKFASLSSSLMDQARSMRFSAR